MLSFYCLLLFAGIVSAVDRSKFRTCDSTSFCRRLRASVSPATYGAYNFAMMDEYFATVDLTPKGHAPLTLTVCMYNNFIPRIRIMDPADKRADYSSDILLPQLKLLPLVKVTTSSDFKKLQLPSTLESDTNSIVISHLEGNDDKVAVVITLRPIFKVSLFVGGIERIKVNDRNMFFFENTRKKGGKTVVNEAVDKSAELIKEHGDIVDYTEAGAAIYADGYEASLDAPVADDNTETASSSDADDGKWEERWGGHVDSKPFGPQGVSVDVSFRAEVLYGIPEHATSMALKNTKSEYQEPYRLYNLDVFEYELDVTMALYGSIPFMTSHGASGTHGFFSLNPTEAFIDVEPANDGEWRQTQWISESGNLDILLLPGSSPKRVLRQYASLTGGQALPPLFSIAYHQCRWNYKDEIDVANVHSKFEELDFPYDVLWLDIEHTDGKRYFTWDNSNFPDPKSMQEKLAAHGRKMVTIIDPHIKRDSSYTVHAEATAKGLYVKNKGGK
jgi:alpha 1,3-glucosidase